MKTEVCLTVDTEFSIAGTFDDPARRSPVAEANVRCEVGGRSHGLGFLLETFAAHGLRATFFVEALNTAYFGDAPMGNVAQEIAAAGHDVQLHLHPVWTYFADSRWRERLATTPPNDSFVGRAQADVEAAIGAGRAAFARWGLPVPVALRTGGLHVDPTVYRAMRAQGIPLGSNVGLGIFRPSARMLQLYGGLHRVEDVTEVPVLTYRRLQIGGRYVEKLLTITGTSWREMRALLESAHTNALGPVVVLTHPHEFVKPGERGALARNRVNQERLAALCRFLAAQRERYEVVTFAQRAQEWTQRASSTTNTCLTVPLAYAVGGMLENKLNDWLRAY